MAYKTLRKLRRFLDNIPDINCGGCGISALVIYKWLKAHGHKNIEFVFYYNDSVSFRSNRQALKNKKVDYMYAPSHCGIRLENNDVIDCSGKINGWADLSHSVNTIGFMKKFLNSPQAWNPRFNRPKYLPIIEKKTGIKLSGVSKYGGWKKGWWF